MPEQDVEPHPPTSQVGDLLEGETQWQAATRAAVSARPRIGIVREAGVPDPVEGIRGVALVAVVLLVVGAVSRPEVEIVAAARGGGSGGGETGVLEEAVGTDEVHLLVPFLIVVRPFVHVPQQQSPRGDFAVVVAAVGLAVLYQEILVARYRHPEDSAAGVDLFELDAGHALLDDDESLVVRSEPSELGQRPGAERVGAVLDAPSQGPQTHQAPFADAGAVDRRIQLAARRDRRLVEQIRQSEDVSELVRHRRRGDREGVPALGRAAGAGMPAADADDATPCRRVVGEEVALQPQRAEPGRRAHEEIARHRQQVDEDDVDVPVVVTRVRHAVWTVVVELAHVDVGVGLLEDLQVEDGEVPFDATLIRHVRGRR